MSEFKRENRYLVIKLSDAEKYLNELDMLGIEGYINKIDKGRINDGKHSFPKCVVVESGWPEYEPTWKAIEKRMTGKGVDVLDSAAKIEVQQNQITRLKKIVEAAKELYNLKAHKTLHGKDSYYLENKEKAWSNLELALHHNAKCEASCGYCANEAALDN